jgi:hypothetical protein
VIRHRYAFIPDDYRQPVVFGWRFEEGGDFVPDEPTAGTGLLVFVKRCDDTPTEPPAPYVCPGCFAVGGERCAPGCIDNEIETEYRDAIERGDYSERFDDDEQDG